MPHRINSSPFQVSKSSSSWKNVRHDEELYLIPSKNVREPEVMRDDFLFLPVEESAKRLLYPKTLLVIGGCLLASLAFLKIVADFFGVGMIVALVGAIAMLYVVLMVFKLYVVYRSGAFPFYAATSEELATLQNEDLPVYTILIPLYREEDVILQIIAAMTAIDYPREKLDIIITLEEYDHQTISAIEAAHTPYHFKTLILPNVNPKTKPKALNVALLKARGEFLVIYDAEIVPDPDQLKKAVYTFRRQENMGVLQTRLDHYNKYQNFLTKLFNTEFSFYYDLFLPGLESLRFPIPLSGHSTHFRMSVLEQIGGWDPYNVTEDCDVGMRVARLGIRTGILDSASQEEATSTLKSWVMQRTRWMKGFIQTSMVHLRNPIQFTREIGGWRNLMAFMLLVPISVIVNFLNLFFWILFTMWVLWQPEFIQNLFPGHILYISVTSFIVGNFIFTLLNLLGSYGRARYKLVTYGLFSPVYWVLLAVAATRALIQVVVSPHSWEKTKHGDHLTAGISALGTGTRQI